MLMANGRQSGGGRSRSAAVKKAWQTRKRGGGRVLTMRDLAKRGIEVSSLSGQKRSTARVERALSGGAKRSMSHAKMAQRINATFKAMGYVKNFKRPADWPK
jgi:hypothetical protein